MAVWTGFGAWGKVSAAQQKGLEQQAHVQIRDTLDVAW